MNFIKRKNCVPYAVRDPGPQRRPPGQQRARPRGPSTFTASRGWYRMSLCTFFGCLSLYKSSKSVYSGDSRKSWSSA